MFPSYDLGEEFNGDVLSKRSTHSFVEMISRFGDVMDLQPEGYAVDKKFPEIVYVPASARFDLQSQRISWTNPASGEQSIKPATESFQFHASAPCSTSAA